jgi:hypothetical protein
VGAGEFLAGGNGPGGPDHAAHGPIDEQVGEQEQDAEGGAGHGQGGQEIHLGVAGEFGFAGGLGHGDVEQAEDFFVRRMHMAGIARARGLVDDGPQDAETGMPRGIGKNWSVGPGPDWFAGGSSVADVAGFLLDVRGLVDLGEQVGILDLAFLVIDPDGEDALLGADVF